MPHSRMQEEAQKRVMMGLWISFEEPANLMDVYAYYGPNRPGSTVADAEKSPLTVFGEGMSVYAPLGKNARKNGLFASACAFGFCASTC